jgi:hypothetical protein
MLLTPEVEALLRDIARDPNSSLLRVERPARLRPFFAREAPASPLAAGLSTPERELVRAHRAEAAFLLRQACLMKLYAGPEIEIERRLVRQVTVDKALEIPELGDWKARGKRALDADAPDRAPADELALLERCVNAGSLDGASVAQLAAASLRLEPADNARIYAGLELLATHSYQLAGSVFDGIISSSAMTIDSAYAWNNLGAARAATIGFGAALLCAREALRVSPDLALARVNVLIYEWLGGTLDGARDAASWVDAVTSAQSDCIRSIAAAHSSAVLSGKLAISTTARARLQAHLEFAGNTSRSLIRAFLSD